MEQKTRLPLAAPSGARPNAQRHASGAMRPPSLSHVSASPSTSTANLSAYQQPQQNAASLLRDYAKKSRQSRRRCEICNKRYEGEPGDIVVGYIQECGHFFHCLCLDGYIRVHKKCPRCYRDGKDMSKAGLPVPASADRVLTSNDVGLAFLRDVIQQETSERPHRASSPANLGRSTNQTQGQPFVVEMDKF